MLPSNVLAIQTHDLCVKSVHEYAAGHVRCRKSRGEFCSPAPPLYWLPLINLHYLGLLIQLARLQSRNTFTLNRIKITTKSLRSKPIANMNAHTKSSDPRFRPIYCLQYKQQQISARARTLLLRNPLVESCLVFLGSYFPFFFARIQHRKKRKVRYDATKY